MNIFEYNEFKKAIREQKKAIRNNPEYARKMLINAGILTKSGKIAKRYRPLPDSKPVK